MEDVRAKAKFYDDEARRATAMSVLEDSAQRRKVMVSIAELYYLLHDKFVELDDPIPPCKVIKFKH